MKYEIIILSILLFIFICILIFLYKKNKQLKNQLKQKINDIIECNKKEIADACEQEKAKLNIAKVEFQSLSKNLQEQKKLLNDYEQHLEEERGKIEKRNNELCTSTFETLYKLTKKEYEDQLTETLKILKLNAFEEYARTNNYFDSNIKQLQNQLAECQNEVNEWQQKREAINRDIMRQRREQEQEDFYRIVLSEDAISDIKILLDVKQRLHLPSQLNKLIYDGYVAKAVTEMIKRVLEGRAPSGIYKITRLKTREIYIGQSTNVKNRWAEHCKSCFNVGTIAHSVLHTTMQKDGIENFTFELLEECPKDQLTEREKFYINLYNSKNYGLNEKL